MTDLPPNVTIAIICALVTLAIVAMFLAYMYYQTIRQGK